MTAFRNLAERYEYVGSLGSGGMSTVYKARDKVLDRVVAIKQLIGELHTEAMVLRFEREAKAYAALQHRNIVSVYDFGTDENNKPFLVMDFVEGEMLDEVIASGAALSIEVIIEIFSQLLDGLSHAHQKSIVHRDLKPANVMIQGIKGSDVRNIVVKLMDFGIAKLKNEQDEGAFLTQPGSVIGSPLYMSPEQGAASEVDLRSDIYSVGCMLFEALIGRPPFKGDTAMKTIFAHRSSELPDMDELARFGSIRADLESILRKALEKRPESRYQSASAMRQDLLAVAEKMRREKVECERKSRSASMLTKAAGGFVATIALGALAYWGLTLIENQSEENSKMQKTSEPPVQAESVIQITDEKSDFWGDDTRVHYRMPNHESPLTQFKAPADVHLVSLGRAFPVVSTRKREPSEREKKLLVGIDRLPMLDTVILNNFSLSDEEINQFARIKILRSLTLVDCRLPAGGLEALSRAKRLNLLSLKNSEVEDLDGISKLQSLKGLVLASMTIHKPLPLADIAKLSNLELLDLQSEHITDNDLTTLLPLEKLNRLNLSACLITSRGCKIISQMKNLNHLVLDWTPTITDEAVKYLTRLPKLRTLHLNITGITDASLLEMEKMPELQNIEVGQTGITKEGLSRFMARCPKIKIGKKGDAQELQTELLK